MDTKDPKIERTSAWPTVTPETQSGAPAEVTPELSEAEREKLRADVLREISERATSRPAPTASSEPTKPTTPVEQKTELLKRIESVLEEDLRDTYFTMDPTLKEKFKREGELTAAKIETLFSRGKASAEKVFKLVLQWLKIIPGVNKFFLKQEAKIKTDRIMDIHS